MSLYKVYLMQSMVIIHLFVYSEEQATFKFIKKVNFPLLKLATATVTLLDVILIDNDFFLSHLDIS